MSVAAVRRLILFLQQSSVEWASSLWLKVVQEVDPTFQRTVSGAGSSNSGTCSGQTSFREAQADAVAEHQRKATQYVQQVSLMFDL
jgi:hypothetical protein